MRPRNCLVLFVFLAGVPLVALGWLGWRLMEQDRQLEIQREQDRLENAGGLLAHELDQNLAASESLLAAAADGAPVTSPPDSALLVFNASGVVRREGLRLPYHPQVASAPGVSGEIFAAAEALELKTRAIWPRFGRLGPVFQQRCLKRCCGSIPASARRKPRCGC